MNPPSIEQRDAMTVVGVGGDFVSGLSPSTNSHEIIPPLWHAFINRMSEVPSRVDGATYGVCVPLEGTDEACHYVAGLAVTDASSIPDGMERIDVPAATYAIFTHRGSIDLFGETLQGIYGEWLPASEYRRAAGADIELYDRRWTGGEDSELEVWIPVEKRG
jgi:AraC family transcriptional regulator